MCLTPIPIPNKTHKARGEIRYKVGKDTVFEHYKLKKFNLNSSEEFQKYKDNESQYIYVPCGVCKQCIAIAQMELIERVQMEALHSHIYMATLTYKESRLPRITLPPWEDKEGYQHEGYTYRYAKYEDASEMMKRLRANNPFKIPFKYLIVTERGSKRARPHFHILLTFKKEDIGDYLQCLNFEQKHKWDLLNAWKRNIGTRRHPIYQELCDYVENFTRGKKRATYDFHYVNPRLTKGGVTDAAFYVLKYMMKGKLNLDTKRALYLNYGPKEGYIYWERIKDRREYSLGFGLDVNYSKKGKDRKITEEICNSEIIDYLRKGINRSKEIGAEYAYYFSPEALTTFPLANYYKRFQFIYGKDDEKSFFEINPERYLKNIKAPDRKDGSQIIQQIDYIDRILEKFEFEDIADEFDNLLKEK